MRDITVEGKKQRTLSCPKRPESWKVLKLHGERVAINSDTLRVVALDKGESPPAKASSVKPQFSLASVGPTKFIVLNVTHGCNLACLYCFARDYDKMPIMSPDLARETINKLFEPRSDIRISFFGGEPLMAWDTVKQTIQYVKGIASARRVKCNLHITTNGTLLTEDRA